MEIRRVLVLKDVIYWEGGLAAQRPVTRVAAAAVILNPLAGRGVDDLSDLMSFGAELGALLAAQAVPLLPGPAVAYGKGAIVGTAGDVEHGAAVVHPRMGRPMREAIGGGRAIIPSTVKVGSAATPIDIPIGHKDDVWSFDHLDTITILVGGAPRPEEIVVVAVVSDGGRPRPRVGSGPANAVAT